MSENKMKVRIVANLPCAVAFGGFERRAVRTALELSKVGLDAKVLDWHNPEDNFDILILFGLNGQWSRIIDNIGKNKKIVVMHINSNAEYNLITSIKIYIREKILEKMGVITEYALRRKILKRCDLIVCLNSLEKINLINIYGKDIGGKIFVQNNGVDDRMFEYKINLNENRTRFPYVLFVGSICRRKNPLLLAKALEENNIKGIFVGETLEEEIEYSIAFENYINKSNFQEWRRGEGWQNDSIINIFRNAILLCLISESETQPQVILEAMACGLPCLISDTDYAKSEPFDELAKIKMNELESLGARIKKILSEDSIKVIKLDDKYRWSSVAESLKVKLEEVYEKNC